jgi:hypothetical protein
MSANACSRCQKTDTLVLLFSTPTSAYEQCLFCNNRCARPLEPRGNVVRRGRVRLLAAYVGEIRAAK